ncbi:uncharacterized protein PFL1_00595 [Pseudozyma flocculosa PF-1]|uniref:Related to Oxalate decarboxylase OxdC n=1 Tax=Pseudozyma flocculosa TaxID=84751 RepID=A0A5C3ESZ1_9BASI|nr:uncharacterized protein PFL1_00595 [Pseudozyma flocculosa PF-1]EPQ32399.1 hypothetical protein PFL1_00595 [Pseudozyma flocculosa PF-1]SPO34626.1 related to Oxalate decarboxylase OxdC [Pseudozyma flocculosa]
MRVLSALPFLSLLSMALAIPFDSAKSLTTLRKRDEAVRAFDEQVMKRAKNVASTYPVEYRSNISDYSLWEQFQREGVLPQPVRGKTGATNYGPDNTEISRQNPDIFAPPSTDHGTIPQAKWPFALSHNRLETGGWARQQNVDVLPVATEMAGVNMRLEKGAFRELHWHATGEWAYVLNGTTRISAVDPDGKNYVHDVKEGDLWFFPAGTPHTLQAVSDQGSEFLLVFDDGSFSEDSTLLLTDWLAHIPKEVIAKNFGAADLSSTAYDKFPSEELYIFPSTVDNSTEGTTAVDNPQGQRTKSPFFYPYSDMEATKYNGGSAKVLDSTKFSASTIASALVTIEPGAMRELHWHPNSPEWDYFIQGHARMTIFAGSTNARTYDFQAGDTAYIKEQSGHYIENIGNDTVVYLELFKAPKYQDISLSNWLALTPPNAVKAHLGFSDDDMNRLYNTFKTKNSVVTRAGSGLGHNNGNKPHDKRSLVDDAPAALVAGKRSFY